MMTRLAAASRAAMQLDARLEMKVRSTLLNTMLGWALPADFEVASMRRAVAQHATGEAPCIKTVDGRAGRLRPGSGAIATAQELANNVALHAFTITTAGPDDLTSTGVSLGASTPR